MAKAANKIVTTKRCLNNSKSNEKEVQLYNQANDTFCGEVRKGIEEALSKSSVPFTAINRGQNEIHSEDDQKTKNLHNIQEKGNDQETEPINQSFEYFE